MNQCLCCGVETSNPKYCGRSCANRMNNLGRQRNPPKERICIVCGIHYKHGKSISRYCPTCKTDRQYQAKTIKEYRNKLSVRGKHCSWLNAHVRNFNRSWNQELTKRPCANCGYDKHVELCHIQPVASFGEDATLGEVNDVSNVIQLCRNCHWEFDNGLIVINPPTSP